MKSMIPPREIPPGWVCKSCKRLGWHEGCCKDPTELVWLKQKEARREIERENAKWRERRIMKRIIP